MAFCDFVVKYTPEQTTGEELTKRILFSIIIKRLKHRKPAVLFIGGDSGEGKSYSAIRLQELLLEVQGLSLKDYFNDVNVYTPLQYPKKLEALLFEKRLKKVNIICMHEAREVVKAKNWQSFLTQSVADVNAMSRTVKRLGIMIISQFIRDVTSDIRYTLNYYMIVRRPKGKRARLYISVLWKDDRDLEKPKLRKRRLSGYLVFPNGKYKRYVPQYLELSKPKKEIINLFEHEDYKAKATIIRRKLNKLIKQMKEDIGEDTAKIDSMVEWYTTHTENLSLIGKRYKDKIRTSKEFKEMHELSKEDVTMFENKLTEALIKKGLVKNGQEQELKTM